MLVLSEADIARALTPAHTIAAVESALRALHAGTSQVPERQHIAWDENTLLTMPSFSASAMGIKLVSVVPGNTARGLPVTNGLMVLNDRATGLPVALLNAAALTARRTGAVGAVAVKHLSAPGATSVGIVGCGVQGAWQAITVCAVRPIREVFFTGGSPESRTRFAANLRHHLPHVTLTVCADARELLGRTDLVIAATTSATPVLPDEPVLLRGKQFLSVGSYRPDMQELPDAVYRAAGCIVMDSVGARHEAGDIINPVRHGFVAEQCVFPLEQIVAGARPAPAPGTAAFKSTGMALFDLFAAQTCFAVAKRLGLGRAISV